jgi:hypothetical protein
MTNATMTANETLTNIKAFAATLDGFKADFDRRKKSEWLAAIQRYEAAKTAATEALEPIATNTVEPIALAVEDAAVKAHAKLTSPKAISGYQLVLRGAIWMGVGLVLTIGLAYALAMLAWDAIDGEPAVVAWVKTYSKTPQGRRLRSAMRAQYQAARAEVQLVGAPLVARAKEVRAIVQGGAAKVFGA